MIIIAFSLSTPQHQIVVLDCMNFDSNADEMAYLGGRLMVLFLTHFRQPTTRPLLMNLTHIIIEAYLLPVCYSQFG